MATMLPPQEFVGYGTLPYNDWVNRSLLSYVGQHNSMGEGGYADPWMSQLMSNVSDVYSPLSSPDALAQAVQRIGGYGAIGFDPNAAYNQAAADYALTGYNLSRDANGNVVFPMFNTRAEGTDLGGKFGLPGAPTFGGSDGDQIGGISQLIEAGLLSFAGGAALGAAGGAGEAGASSVAGFGDAAYAGAAGAGSSAAAGAGAGAANLGNAEFGTGAGGITSSSFDAAGGVGAAGSGTVAGGGGAGGGAGGSGTTNNTGTTGGSMGDETGAFDQSGSAGVFDSSGNPIYQQPSYFDQLFGDISGSDIAKFLWNNKGTIGALLGGAAGAASANGTPAGTVTTTTDVPDWLKPYVQGNVAQGSQTLAGINPNNPLLPASQAQALATIRGDYLNPNTNPYLQQNVNDALGLAKSQYLGLYGGPAGLNVNNTGFQEGLTRNLGTVATQAYGQNYANERQNQNAATFGAPQLVSQSNAAYFSPNQAFAGLFPNVSSTQTPYFTNTLGSIFSGALGGGALGKAFS